jgi:uncharacterized membrane protein
MAMKRRLQWVLAGMMVGIGVAHFANPGPFEALVPPQLPAPLALVYISGVFEIAFGLGLMIPRFARWAAWGLVALFVAVYPANIYHAVSGGLSHPDLPPFMDNGAVAILRLPFQFLFIAWAWWYTRAPSPHADQ